MSVPTITSQHAELHVLHLQKDGVNITTVEDPSDHEKKKPSPNASQWRPAFHLSAPSGWLNDPCGLGYDPSTGLYHVAFQWNPKGNDWGNTSWGNSTSYDLVSWKTSPEPYLTPSTEYDHCGIFTGCLQPTDINGHSGALTCFYTSVKHLPIHYTLPYIRGCESLSLAVTHDGGVTWQRQSCNPILTGPPSHLRVTSWRDPYVGSCASMQHAPDMPSSNLYGFLSGGIVGKTPTVFAYAINPKDLRDWEFIGHLADVGLNFRPSRWSGDFGVNWEVANVLDLSSKEEGISRTFVIVGAEGCLESDDNVILSGDQVKARTARIARQQLWMALKAKSTSDNHKASSNNALLTYSFAGVFDHGCYYAANSFYDPMTDQHIVYGWITEEDLPDHLRYAQGWSGLISLPRTVKLAVLHNVISARRSELQTITSIETEADSQGTYTVRTLGVQPDDRLKRLRAKASSFTLQNVALHPCSPAGAVALQTSKWEVEATFAVHRQCTRVGIQLAHSAGMPNGAIPGPLSIPPKLSLHTNTFPPSYVQISHTALSFHGNHSLKPSL